MAGQQVCRMHGGAIKRNRAKAAERVLEERARALVPGDVGPVANPLEELLRLAGEILAFKDNVGRLVADLDGQVRFRDAKGAEQLRSEVAVYERALDRAEKALADITRLGIEDRLARVSELQASALAVLIDRVLQAVGVDSQDPRVAAVVVEELGRT